MKSRLMSQIKTQVLLSGLVYVFTFFSMSATGQESIFEHSAFGDFNSNEFVSSYVDKNESIHRSNVSEKVNLTVELNESDLSLRINSSTGTYQLEAPSEEFLKIYYMLDENTQKKFIENRIKFMTLYTKVIHSLRHGLGTGQLIKDNLVFAKDKVMSLKKGSSASLDNGNIASSENAINEKIIFDNFSQRSSAIVNGFLQSFDNSILQSPEFFAKANEAGIVVGGNVVAIADVKNIKLGGSVGLGISIGFNIEKMSVVFQVFRDYESYQSSALKALGVVGAIGKGGVYIVNDRDTLFHDKGVTFYPPVAPAFASKTPNKLISGASTGLTIPPSPVADILTYTNKLDQKTVLKVEMKKSLKHFVRVKFINAKELIMLELIPLAKALSSTLTQPIAKYSKNVYSKITLKRQSHNQCVKLFN